MAKKIEKNLEGKTLEQIMDMLKDTAVKHNDSKDPTERAKLEVEADKLRDAYNVTSLHTAYANILEQQNPMLAFIKQYQYPVVKVSLSKETKNLEISTENSKGEKLTEVFNLWDFVAYCEDINKQVTAALDWKSKAKAAKEVLIKNVQKYIEDGTEKDVLGLKTALQEMFNSVVFVSGKNGNNAVIAKSKQAREIYMTCGRMDVKKLQSMFGREQTWQKQAFAYLHCAVEGKEFTCIYGDPEDEKKTAPAAEEKTEE